MYINILHHEITGFINVILTRSAFYFVVTLSEEKNIEKLKKI